MLKLLVAWDPNIPITKRVVTAAAGNERGIMDILIDREPNITITDNVVTAAATTELVDGIAQLLETDSAIATESSLGAAAFFGRAEWFQRLQSKIDVGSWCAKYDMQSLVAAIEGGNTAILKACMACSRESYGIDDHGWTLHMVAIQSRNETAIEIFRNASMERMLTSPITSWEVDPTISSFVSTSGDGTKLTYSGKFSPLTTKFPALMIIGNSLGSEFSVRGNHPFPPGHMGRNYFEVGFLGSAKTG
jgi:hypothetical protein